MVVKSDIEFAMIVQNIKAISVTEFYSELLYQLNHKGWNISETCNTVSLSKDGLIVINPPESDMWQLRFVRPRILENKEQK